MKPMNSSVLNSILDKLADIGKKHVAKSNTMLKSMNIKDDIIKIASREVIRDTVERKLRLSR
jgi:hypothetical protein